MEFALVIIEIYRNLNDNSIMTENVQAPTSYIETLQSVLLSRKDWLEKEEAGKLKEDLRTFQTSYASLYKIYLEKKLIDEDPYKHEQKISELAVPDTSVIIEAKRIEQLSIRLAAFDNQLDFLVNFYQLNTDFLNLDRIKRIVGLVRYIDWLSLTPDSKSPITKAVAELTQRAKVGVDAITLSIIGENLKRLGRSTAEVMAYLKNFSSYYREEYKLIVRQKILAYIPASDATLENIRKKMQAQMQGSPFYKELIEEILKEEHSPEGSELRDAVLNSMKVAVNTQKKEKPAIDYKAILLDGIIAIGSASAPLVEICQKLDENQTVMENHKKSFLEVLKELIRQLTKAEPDPVIYTVEYMDQTKGIPIKEKVNYHRFREDLEKKNKILTSFARGAAYQKLAVMTDEQIIGYLERNIKDVQNFHKILGALDDYFKINVETESRSKIKGIKPELSILKNSYVKANQLRYDYTARKEEEEQLKRLGVNPAVIAGAGVPIEPSAAAAPLTQAESAPAT